MEQRIRGEADLREHFDQLSGGLLGMATRRIKAGERSLGERFAAVALDVARRARTYVYDTAALATIVASAVPIVAAINGAGH